ncbi:MAG: HAMP domain-containing sensor histidine kinase [Bacteroidota bacterium]
MKTYVRNLLICFGLLLNTFNSFAQEYVSFHYTQQNGLPQNSVINVWFDKHQFLWLTTESGLVRFDGSLFKTFQSSSYPQISNDRFRWIHQTTDHKLVTSNSDGQLWQIQQNTIQPVPNQRQLEYQPFAHGIPTIETIVDIENAGKYFLRTNGVRTYPAITVPMRNKEYYIVGLNYIYSFNGLVKIDSIDIQRLPQIEAMFRIGSNLYIKTSGKNILHVDPIAKSFTTCTLQTPVGGNIFTLYWKMGYENPLIACNNKLYALTIGENAHQFKLKSLLNTLPVPHTQINQILYNPHRDIIVIATTTNGFYVFKPGYFKTVNAPGISGAYGQIAISDSSILDGLGYEIGPNSVNKSKYRIHSENGVLLKDYKNNIWYSNGDSLFIYQNGNVKSLVKDPENRFSAIFQHGDTMIVSSYRIIYVFIRGRMVSMNPLPKPLNKSQETARPFCLIRFKNHYYYGCSDGVFTFDIINKKINSIKKVANTPNVRYLYPTENFILGCSYGTGLFAIDNNNVISFPLDKKMHLSKAHSIRIDSQDRVFISTNNGLFYTTLTTVKNHIAGTQKSIHYQYMNDNEGIANVEFNGGCSESSLSMPNGYFSFSNMGGFVWFKPSSIKDNFPNNPIYVDYISIDGLQQPLSDTLQIASDAEQISIAFTSAYWGNNYNIESDYKIETYHKDWIPHSSEHSEISLIHVPSGTHKLILRMRTGFGDNDYHTRSFILIKDKRYYENLWFLFLCIALLALIILALNRAYNQRLRTQNQLLEQRVSSRTQELQESNSNLQKSQQELLQAVNVKNKLISIISHDIVTPIKFISIVSRNFKSENNNTAQEKEVIREIHHTSQRLHENAQNILNWVRYQNNLIKVHETNIAPYSLVEEISDLLQEIALSRKNTIVNEVEMDDIIKTDKTIITIILQNLISNAVKYTHSSIIRISSNLEAGKYKITIADDGQGMSKHNLQRIENILSKTKTNMFDDSADGTGLGYIIVFELAELIGATINVYSSPERGTTIEIIL